MINLNLKIESDDKSKFLLITADKSKFVMKYAKVIHIDSRKKNPVYYLIEDSSDNFNDQDENQSFEIKNI